jgi:hypothetical protein
MSREQTKLFDTSLYKQSNLNVVAEDLAGLYIEAGDNPLEQRINARKLIIIGDKVFDPITDKEVPGNLKHITTLDNLEADSAEAFYKQLAGGYDLTVSFSPPGGLSPYKEGRINVGYRSSHNEIEFYGIPTLITPETMLAKTILLSEFSDVSLSKISSPEQLRQISLPISIPSIEESPWDFLEEVLPLDSNAWKYIKDGRPWIVKENALKDAKFAAPVMIRMIYSARTENDYIMAGIYGERYMEQMGWKLNSGSCAGASNSQLAGTSISEGKFVTDVFGNTREIIESSFPCPRCGGSIPSGLGITTCPHCGLTKEEAGSTCG